MTAFVNIMPDRSLQMTMAGEERIRTARDVGTTITALAAEFHVSIPTMRRWAEDLGCAGMPRNLSTADWNESKIALLTQLWNEGHSANEIARRMHTTKNAVIGKAHRLDLPRRRNPIQLSATPKPRQPRRAPRWTLGRLPSLGLETSRPVVLRPRPQPSPISASAPPAQVSIKPQLSKQTCCWPIGEPRSPGFRFCDAPAVLPYSYCPVHCAIGFRNWDEIKPSWLSNEDAAP